MSKKDYHVISKNIDKIYKRGYSNFLMPLEINQIKSKDKNFKIFSPYKWADRKIVYNDIIPEISVFEIISYESLTHRQIMGSIYNLSIDPEVFGDIIIYNDKYYVFILSLIKDIFIKEFDMVGCSKIKLKEVPISTLSNYERKFEIIKIICSSLRMDSVVSKLVGVSRDKVKRLFKEDNVILNYLPYHRLEKNLKIGDVFSIKRYGKYIFDKVISETKKGGYIIILKKYI